MKKIPLIAVALSGVLSSNFIYAKDARFTSTGWNGGVTILGNMRGVLTNKKYYTLDASENFNLGAGGIDTNKRAYGIVFEKSSYRTLIFTSTTMNFSSIRSSANSASGLDLKNNQLTLQFQGDQAKDVGFWEINARDMAMGISLFNSQFQLLSGGVWFESIRSIASEAVGLLANGNNTRAFVQLSAGRTSTLDSAIVKINSISGKNAYGVKFDNTTRGATLDLRSNSRNVQGERGGLYFANISASGFSDSWASAFYSQANGDVTDIQISGSAIFKTQNIDSTKNASALAFRSGSARVILSDTSSFQVYSIQANNAYGVCALTPFSFSLNHNATFSISQISANENVYGFYTQSQNQYLIHNNAQVILGSLSGNQSYGFLGSELNARMQDNGSIVFESIKSENRSVGINADSIHIDSSGASTLYFKNITSTKESNGIRFRTDVTVNASLRDSQVPVLHFGTIQSKYFNAIGIYIPRDGRITLDNRAKIKFDMIKYVGSSNNITAGFVSDGGITQLVFSNASELEFSNLSSSSNAYGLKLHSLNLIFDTQSSLTVGELNARQTAVGLLVIRDSEIKLVSSNIYINNLTSSSSEVFGFRIGGDAYFKLAENSQIRLRNIVSTGSDAYGIYSTSHTSLIKGDSVMSFDVIKSDAKKAIGLYADDIDTTLQDEGKMFFGDINSTYEANGIRVKNELKIDVGYASKDALVFNKVRSNSGNALGVYIFGNNGNITFHGSSGSVAFKDISHFGESSCHFAGGIVSDGSRLNLTFSGNNITWFDKIASNNQAFGIRANSMSMHIDSQSELIFGKISGRNNAYGLYSHGGDVSIDGGGRIKISEIYSSRASRYGIYTPNTTLDITNTSLIFGSKNNSASYGIYNNIDGLKYQLADTSITINTDNGSAIYAEQNAKAFFSLGDYKTFKLEARARNGMERVAIEGDVSLNLGRGSNLIFNSDAGEIKVLDVANQANINLAGTNTRTSSSRGFQFRQLSVEKWNGSNANIVLYVNATERVDTSNFNAKAYQPSRNKAQVGGSDRIVINGTNASSRQDNTLKVALSTVDNPIKYVVLAEVKGDAKDKIIFNNLTSNKAYTTTVSEVSFDVADIEITRHDDGNTAYYVGKIPDKNSFRLNQKKAGRVVGVQNASSTVVVANFNNLNKRMGELRENNYSHGVWARVFNGEVESKFGDGSASNYTTIQAGYDYNLNSDLDSNSYLGFALSYLNSKTDNSAEEVRSNGVEAGVYFAYVQDSGLYTDTIAKLAYMSNQNSSSVGYDLTDTSTTSFILSQEIGYQVEVVNGFFLAPQFETTYAFFSGSDMTASQNGVTQLKSTQDATNTWRNRLGLQATYKLQDEDKKFRASFYAVGSYTYDYNTGGDYRLETSKISTIDNAIKSDGRFVLNVGSNIDIKDATRFYVDFEKSFGGKINTNYQINVGVRYNFGEKVPATQTVEKKQN